VLTHDVIIYKSLVKIIIINILLINIIYMLDYEKM